MSKQLRREATGKTYQREAKAVWAIVTVQDILDNDFYIGTLRQGKYTRARINDKYIKADCDREPPSAYHQLPHLCHYIREHKLDELLKGLCTEGERVPRYYAGPA